MLALVTAVCFLGLGLGLPLLGVGGAVHLNAGGKLVADGLPFVPFGCFVNSLASPLGTGTGQAFVSQNLVQDAEVTQGLNLVSPYNQGAPSLGRAWNDTVRFLDRCAAVGVKVNLPPAPAPAPARRLRCLLACPAPPSAGHRAVAATTHEGCACACALTADRCCLANGGGSRYSTASSGASGGGTRPCSARSSWSRTTRR